MVTKGSEELKTHRESLPEEQKGTFIPKRRTPYLLQEEVIKQKNEESKHSLHLKNSINRGQIDVIKESNDSLSVKLDYADEVSRLYGLQKRLAYFFVQCCKKRDQTKTGPVTLQTICDVINTTPKTAKKIIHRMEEKGLLKRLNGKKGRGGFTIFELESTFIDLVKIQAELENNQILTNNTLYSSPVINKSSNNLPEEWEKIDLSSLEEAFKSAKTKNSQFFGKTQLKIIYNQVGSTVSAISIQKSILEFSYGLKHFASEDPYKSMENPAAIFFEKLKNGEQWEEKRYLSPENSALYKIYLNLYKSVEEDKKVYFRKWVDIDRTAKFEHYKKTMRSVDFYGENEFLQKAWDDYFKNIWPNEKKDLITKILNLHDSQIINQFEFLAQQNCEIE